MTTPSPDDQADQVVKEWRARWMLEAPDVLSVHGVHLFCARLHLAAVADKDTEIERLKSLGNRCNDIGESLNLRLALATENYASLEQENRRLVEDGQRDTISFNHAAKFATDAMLKMAQDMDALRQHLRAVCEAAGNIDCDSDSTLGEALTAAAPLLAEQPVGKVEA